FGSGMFLGIEFPLAGKLYQGEKEQLPETCAALYGADLLGGWIAGICGGVFFLPILGVFNTCLVIALLKLSSLSLLISVPKTFDK
ncbi:MAG: hypothetical protein NT033_10215, partial [Candidatus Omnitrophica bacterium]|nr:hypothetical protein [Candidatus Omnitrophota bacterium]